ncbi:uncharacterized protein METZ01_LOCUS151292 [marine metagenome]|uniref:Uncharacterized protein n=1 Tax=marine metagenome TaxID=408172 RepID=A0A382AA68_9ZZZZ
MLEKTYEKLIAIEHIITQINYSEPLQWIFDPSSQLYFIPKNGRSQSMSYLRMFKKHNQSKYHEIFLYLQQFHCIHKTDYSF